MASLTQLRYALAVARHRNFRRAAAACFVSQPTLSTQLRKLEEELEISLFDRSRKPVAPTSDGAQLLDEFRRVVHAYEHTLEVARDLRGVVGGIYRLGIIPTMAPYLLPLLLPRFGDAFPAVALRVEEITTEQIVSRLLDDTLDGGILAAPLDDKRIVEFRLAEERFVVFHSPSVELPTDRDGRVRLDRLPLEKLLVMREGHCLRAQALDLCSLADGAAHASRFVIEAGSMATLSMMVREGPYFTILPLLAAEDLTRQGFGGLVKPIAGPVPFREIALAVHRTESRRAVRDALIKEVRAALAPLRTRRKTRPKPVPPASST